MHNLSPSPPCNFIDVLLVSTRAAKTTQGFQVILDPAPRPNPKKSKWGRSLLLVSEGNKRLLLWIKYDPGVLSLLFHRRVRQEWRYTVSTCIWFPIPSHFLIVSVSASGSYFEKRLSKEENLSVTHSHCWCWRGQSFDRVANGHSQHKWNLLFWMIYNDNKKKIPEQDMPLGLVNGCYWGYLVAYFIEMKSCDVLMLT